MPIRIAIPEPTSLDQEYNQRALPLYVEAISALGAEPQVISLDLNREEKAKIISHTNGVLLPGSKFDVNPERYKEERIPECGASDPTRESLDELLLQDAFQRGKPVLGICQGVQSLNVWLGGSLIQDLKAQLGDKVNHAPGRDIIDAHPVRIVAGSRLAGLLSAEEVMSAKVNSSHHQAIRHIGDKLRASAVSPEDGVVEAVELDALEHFVMGVQWHPERTWKANLFSQAIFHAFVRAASE